MSDKNLPMAPALKQETKKSNTFNQIFVLKNLTLEQKVDLTLKLVFALVVLNSIILLKSMLF